MLAFVIDVHDFLVDVHAWMSFIYMHGCLSYTCMDVFNVHARMSQTIPFLMCLDTCTLEHRRGMLHGCGLEV
jgi:hypothetical protein